MTDCKCRNVTSNMNIDISYYHDVVVNIKGTSLCLQVHTTKVQTQVSTCYAISDQDEKAAAKETEKTCSAQ